MKPPSYEPLYSLVLHGPPGTGKTVLVEGLAKSCNVDLVEITPSDIVIGGADAIERRARAVFKALSLLTRAVILFDEFDPVLLKREADDKHPTVFSFLTPGMLPKLKTLHEKARKRAVAYVLVTNLIGKLDPAAIRDGRFDARLGVYPPDLLSRLGRLSSSVIAYRSTHPETSTPDSAAMWNVVLKTAGGPMNILARPGWFTAPREINVSEANAFAHLFRDIELRIPEPEAKREPIDTSAAARDEFFEWTWVHLWDRVAELTNDRDEALTKLPTIEQVEQEISKVGT